MTTIAYRNGVLACDSQATNGSTIVSTDMKKIFRAVSGNLYGVTGSAIVLEIVKQCLMDEDFSKWDLQSEHTIIKVDVNVPDKLFIKEKNHPWLELTADYHAFGSGADFAMGAMSAGHSAYDAIKTACELDIYSSGPIQQLTADKPLTKPSLKWKFWK